MARSMMYDTCCMLSSDDLGVCAWQVVRGIEHLGTVDVHSMLWRVVDVRGPGHLQPLFLSIDGTDKMVGLNHDCQFAQLFRVKHTAAATNTGGGIPTHLNDYRLHMQFFANDEPSSAVATDKLDPSVTRV